MTKQKIIDTLIGMLITCNTEETLFSNGYNSGLIEALKLVHRLEEPAKTTFTQAQKIEQVLREKLSRHLTTTELDELIMHMGNGDWLNAIKTYKEATGMGLKEAKAEIDDARYKLQSIE